MTYAEIMREVGENIKGAKATIIASVSDYINEAYQQICEERQFGSLVYLTAVNSVVGQAYTTLPAILDGRLTYVGTTNGRVEIAKGGLVELLEDQNNALTQVGDILKVALEGTTLYYYNIPSTATVITIVGYRTPTLLTDPSDIPSILPIYLHRALLVSKASALAYSKIEEGLEGIRPNTAFYEAEYQKGLTDLDTWLAKRTSNMSRSIWSQ